MGSNQFEKCLKCIVHACCTEVCSDYKKWIRENFYISTHKITALKPLQETIKKVVSFRYKDF